jgi:acetyl/propionyl-CoA carboxylase alpha subunit
MIIKGARQSRQSPLQKAANWGENALRVIGTAKSIYDTGQAIYAAGQVAAPYVAAAVSFL